MKRMEQEKRIEEMEALFDRCSERMQSNGLEGDELRKEMERLIAYYESPLWMKDFEDDQAGKIRSDLKRGVLSEDGIFNLLTEWAETEQAEEQTEI